MRERAGDALSGRRRSYLRHDECRSNAEVEILLEAADAAIVAATKIVFNRLLAPSTAHLDKMLSDVRWEGVSNVAAVVEIVRFARLNRRRGARVADQLRRICARSRVRGELWASIRFVA